MGSFTEVVLSFNFADGTPDHVLAAFSSLAVPHLRDGAPRLPPPVVEGWDLWSPDWREAGYPEGQGDPFEAEPWRHDWASWTSTAMGVQTTPHGMLQWSELGAWNLDCRFSWKTDPVTAGEALAWLGPYIGGGNPDGKVLAGYAHFEYAPRPHLFWVGAGRWEIEDLNPNDEWMWG
jgi:hypothetical protein